MTTIKIRALLSAHDDTQTVPINDLAPIYKRRKFDSDEQCKAERCTHCLFFYIKIYIHGTVVGLGFSMIHTWIFMSVEYNWQFEVVKITIVLRHQKILIAKMWWPHVIVAIHWDRVLAHASSSCDAHALKKYLNVAIWNVIAMHEVNENLLHSLVNRFNYSAHTISPMSLS